MSRWKKPGGLAGAIGVTVGVERDFEREVVATGEASSGSTEARSGVPAGAVLAVPRSLRSEMLQRLEAMK